MLAKGNPRIVNQGVQSYSPVSSVEKGQCVVGETGNTRFIKDQ